MPANPLPVAQAHEFHRYLDCGVLARQRFRQARDDPPWQAPDDLPLRITIAEAVRLGLERLCRYGLRAPSSQDRLSLDPDGRVRYRLHRPWPTPEGRTEIVLEPVASLKRLSAASRFDEAGAMLAPG